MKKEENLLKASKNVDFYATYQFKFGLFYYNHSKINQALPWFENSLSLFNQLAVINPIKYVEDQSETINNIAAIYSRNNQFKKAIPLYNKAINLLRDNEGAIKDGQYLMALALTNKGNSLFLLNDYDNATAVFNESLTIWEKLYQNDVVFYKPKLANNYNSFGALHKRKGDYQQAENAYLRALELRQELASTQSHKNMN